MKYKRSKAILARFVAAEVVVVVLAWTYDATTESWIVAISIPIIVLVGNILFSEKEVR